MLPLIAPALCRGYSSSSGHPGGRCTRQMAPLPGITASGNSERVRGVIPRRQRLLPGTRGTSPVLAPFPALRLTLERQVFRSVEARALVQVQKSVPFGQSLKVVGSHPALGEWSVQNGLSLEWSEGDVWMAEVTLPPGTHEFKCVVVGGGSDVWEVGDNRILQVPEEVSGIMGVSLDYGNPMSMLIEETIDGGRVPVQQQESPSPEASEGQGLPSSDMAATNAAHAREWIAAWRSKALTKEPQETTQSGKASIAFKGVAERTDEAAERARGAREWISAWKASNKAGGAGVDAAAAETPETSVLAAAGSSISRQSAVVVDEEASVSDGAAWAGIIVGLLSIPVVAWSEYTLFSTGCGLPPGPSGLLGATEGVSYLVVAALALWSLSSKASTAKGLPPGPGGLLGAVEGLSYLVILAGFGVLCYQIYDKGFVPSALPSGACYGDQPIEPLDLSAILASIKEGAQPLTEQAGPGMQKVRDQSQALVDSLPTQAELQAAVESAWQAAMAQAGSLREAAKPAMDEAMASVQKLKDQLPTKAEVRAAAESTTTAVKAQADSLKAAAQAAKEQAVDVARQMALQMKEWIPTMPDINSRIK